MALGWDKEIHMKQVVVEAAESRISCMLSLELQNMSWLSGCRYKAIDCHTL